MEHDNTLTVSCSGNSKEQGVVINNTLIITLYIFVSSVRLDGIINEETFSLLSWDVWLDSRFVKLHVDVHAVLTEERLASCHSAIKLKYSAAIVDLWPFQHTGLLELTHSDHWVLDVS